MARKDSSLVFDWSLNKTLSSAEYTTWKSKSSAINGKINYACTNNDVVNELDDFVEKYPTICTKLKDFSSIVLKHCKEVRKAGMHLLAVHSNIREAKARVKKRQELAVRPVQQQNENVERQQRKARGKRGGLSTVERIRKASRDVSRDHDTDSSSSESDGMNVVAREKSVRKRIQTNLFSNEFGGEGNAKADESEEEREVFLLDLNAHFNQNIGYLPPAPPEDESEDEMNMLTFTGGWR